MLYGHMSNKVHIVYSGGWILVMEIVPGFSLYRGLYELGQYAFSGNSMGASRKEGIPTVSCGILSQVGPIFHPLFYFSSIV